MAAERRILITAGPTYEPIDAVRFIGNRSSGRLGCALAAAARDAGWDVTLLLGPVAQDLPEGIAVHRFETSDELADLLDRHFPNCDMLIMAAAVADYRPPVVSERKTPRTAGSLTLKLEPVPDLVAQCAEQRRPGQRIVGFALEEPTQLASRAKEKLRRKGVDYIVANPLATMGAGSIQAVVFTADGREITPPNDATDKSAFSRWLIEFLSGE